MRPIDRFGLDLTRIRFLPPGDVNDELFFVEQDRTVLADNTFSLKNTRFEVPRDLRSRKVQIRFDRLKFDGAQDAHLQITADSLHAIAPWGAAGAHRDAIGPARSGAALPSGVVGLFDPSATDAPRAQCGQVPRHSSRAGARRHTRLVSKSPRCVCA